MRKYNKEFAKSNALVKFSDPENPQYVVEIHNKGFSQISCRNLKKYFYNLIIFTKYLIITLNYIYYYYFIDNL